MSDDTTSEPAALRADYEQQAARVARVLDGARGRWAAPSPCAGWDTRAVVEHLVSTERDFLARHDLPMPSAPDLTGDDVAGGWRTHVDATSSALTDDVLERAFDGYFGPTTIGRTWRDFYTWDLLIHAWDLARATGQDFVIDEVEAQDHHRAADGWGEALYADGVCGPPIEVADDAPASERLLARLGRDPHWTSAG